MLSLFSLRSQKNHFSIFRFSNSRFLWVGYVKKTEFESKNFPIVGRNTGPQTTFLNMGGIIKNRYRFVYIDI